MQNEKIVYFDSTTSEFTTMNRNEVDGQDVTKYALLCPIYKHAPFKYRFIDEHRNIHFFSMKNGLNLILQLLENGETEPFSDLFEGDEFIFEELLETNLGFVIGCLSGFYNYTTSTFDVPYRFITMFDQLCFYTNTNVISEIEQNEFIQFKCKIEQEFYVREFVRMNASNFKKNRLVVLEDKNVTKINELYIPSLPTTINKHETMLLGKVDETDSLETKIMKGHLILIPFNELDNYEFIKLEKYHYCHEGALFVAGDLVTSI